MKDCLRCSCIVLAMVAVSSCTAAQKKSEQVAKRSEENATRSIADEGFFHPWKIQKSKIPNGLYNAIESSLKMKVKPYTNCSAVAVSNDGYVLTALHCLHSCGPKSEPVVQTSEYKNAGTIMEPTERAPANRRCVGLKIPGLGKDPKIVYLGRGQEFLRYGSMGALSDAEIERLEGLQSDFAVLKFEPSHPIRCLKPAEADSAIGAEVWNIGFPGPNSRPGHKASNGHSEYVSYGHVVGEAPLIAAIQTEAGRHIVERLAFDEAYVISDADVYPGNSGGMAIDRSGRLQGIASQYDDLDDSTSISERWAHKVSRYVRTSHIIRELNEQLGETATARIFACDNSQFSDPPEWRKWLKKRIFFQ